MSEINFKPWVGKDYLTKGYKGQRILVLGESHYCSSELAEGGRCNPVCIKDNMQKDCFLQTIDVVKEFIDNYRGCPYQQTFLCFERAVVGKELSLPERKDFWNSVMFYNYIQYAQSMARKEPMPEHWEVSKKAFAELLSDYKPDKIIVWGVRLFDYLSYLGIEVKTLKVSENETTEVRQIPVNDKEIPAMKMIHPSAPKGKNWRYWHQVINKFLE